MKKTANIREIAELTGYSTATVSRVINDSSFGSEKTRKKIMAVVAERQYVPNRNATNIFKGNTRTIALFLFNLYNMNNPFFNDIVAYLSQITFRNNYSLLLFNCMDELEKEKEYYEYCKSARVSGIIYTAGFRRSEPFTDEETPFPLVMLSNTNRQSMHSYCVRSDDEKAIKILLDYLYNLNHRKIGFITGAMEVLTAQDRLNAYLSNVTRLQLPYNDMFVYTGDFSIQSGVSAFDYFFSLPSDVRPTAILASNDQMAKGFILRASSLGVNIPGDISICGIDSVENDYFLPKITSVRQNTKELAESAFYCICNSDKTESPKRIIVDVSFSAGGTCKRIDL